LTGGLTGSFDWGLSGQRGWPTLHYSGARSARARGCVGSSYTLTDHTTRPSSPQLLASGTLPLRQRLEIILTVAAILRGQGEALNVDRRAFYTQLYAAALLAPLMPLLEDAQAGGGGGGGGGEEDGVTEEDVAAATAADALTGGASGGASAIDAILQQLQPAAPGGGGSAGRRGARGGPEPTAVLLVRALEQLLLGVKQADLGRLAAFTKRLAGLMLQVRRRARGKGFL
jgi:nucleolar complex protein 3